MLLATKTLASDITPVNIASWNEANSLEPNYAVIYKPNPPSEESRIGQDRSTSRVSLALVEHPHSIQAQTTISEEALRQYLAAKGSPLTEYSADLLDSTYWSTIIGICTIEEYGCTHYPNNNMGGLMSSGHLIQFASLADWINAEDRFLLRAATNGHDTIEKLNCWYVVPCSTNWLKTVITTKQHVESL